MAVYCEQDWKRFVYTWGLAAECQGTALELGANPYFTTCLLIEFTKLHLSFANYFGPRAGRPSFFIQKLAPGRNRGWVIAGGEMLTWRFRSLGVPRSYSP